MNELNDPIAGDDDALRLATSFRPHLARLRQVREHDIAPAIGPASRKLDQFDPLDLRVKNLAECQKIVPVKCGVCLPQPLRLSCKGRFPFAHQESPRTSVSD